MRLQKFGGYAAIASICAYVACVVYGNLVHPGMMSDLAKTMTVMSTAPADVYLLSLLGMASYILILAMIVSLHERMHADAPYLSHMMLISISASTVIMITQAIVDIKSIGVITPSQDLSTFSVFWAIRTGLGFAGGHVIGWGVLFLGWAILSTQSFSRVLGWLFLVTGILWVPTFFLIQIGFQFTRPVIVLGSCVATIWIGIALLRQKQLPPAAK